MAMRVGDGHPEVTASVSTDDLRGLTVAEVMVSRPKFLPATATLADVRAAFADDHVHLALLVGDGDVLRSTVTRGDLELAAARGVPDNGSAAEVGAVEGRTIDAGTDAEFALRMLTGATERRRAVIDDQNRLLGLLCVKRSGKGFCGDSDVEARREGPKT
jgi:CBS domain-containing protein